MPDLSRDLRRSLEATVKSARVAAEAGAADALRRLGVAAAELPAHFEALRAARNRLRAHARSLGDRVNKDGTHEIQRLTEAAAYVQWHRLLFARFLLERGLLRDEAGIVLSLSDCREEAVMGGVGDEWTIAAGHAARLLPGVFPPDDPVESLTLAPEHAKALRDHLRGLDAAIFAADDSLGWTYQFWRAAEKKAVNESQVKIGAAELPAVTQLFTEPYMVRFLLHNTLGAWWAGKVLAERPELVCDAPDEAALRAACALPGYAWDYLRFVREDGIWRPAAGSFPGWPRAAAALAVLDPCCGSGHFLTEALAALAALRGAEEGLSPADAVVAVLRDNLHGLEIDGRCVQIAAFALALTAWRIGGAETQLPTPHVAWVGAPPPLPKSEFAALANGDAELRRGLEALHDLFVQAPLLGSLIEVTGGDLMNATRVARIEESIDALVEKMLDAEPERAEGALAARGMADAAAILGRRFVLQVTNVPFLGLSKADEYLQTYVQKQLYSEISDLYIAFMLRMRSLRRDSGTVALVTPQNWYSLVGGLPARTTVLTNDALHLACDLGPAAFHDMNWWAQRTALTIFSQAVGKIGSHPVSSLDAEANKGPEAKAENCRAVPARIFLQHEFEDAPNSVFLMERSQSLRLLEAHAACLQGVSTGDNDRLTRFFFEVAKRHCRWRYFQRVPDGAQPYSGMQLIVDYPAVVSAESVCPAVRGEEAWGKTGIIFGQMRHLPYAIYTGEWYSNSSPVMIPAGGETKLAALWAFVSSGHFLSEVRKINRKSSVDNGYFTKVGFDLTHWQKVAAEKYPSGLPEPYSDNPTQWLFHGHPRYAEAGTELHVALARLAGYRWPAETDSNMRLSAEARARIAEAATLPAADAGGLLALVPVLAERSLADRLRAYCAAAWGDAWMPGTEAALVAAACEWAKDKTPKQATLDAWLSTHAARQHAKLFHDRPFLWWITDGRADGFTAVAHYHRLNRANLERLAWTVLGDWITRLGDDPRAEAARVLQAKLARILEGEKPHDIFVRWKPLEQQPLGWEPDLDDGVRQNIRPFIAAQVLGCPLEKILKDVDRGKDVASAPWFATFNGERRNDHHTSLDEKRAACAALTMAAQ